MNGTYKPWAEMTQAEKDTAFEWANEIIDAWRAETREERRVLFRSAMKQASQGMSHKFNWVMETRKRTGMGLAEAAELYDKEQTSTGDEDGHDDYTGRWAGQ